MVGSWRPGDLPNLTSSNFRITSPTKNRYNCIAWAAGCNQRWWWPTSQGYWPEGVAKEETIEAFADAFAALGYKKCNDASSEDGFEKVAIYAKGPHPTHAARQLSNGKWTSKLGPLEDIEHSKPDDVGGPVYGVAVLFMKRRVRAN